MYLVLENLELPASGGITEKIRITGSLTDEI